MFVYGGLFLNYVFYGLEWINEEVRDWINGVKRDLCRDIGRGRDLIVWLRRFFYELVESCDCKMFEYVFVIILGVRRMIMGYII